MSIDIVKATEKMTFLIAEATIHERTAEKLRSLADDAECEAERLTLEAHRINELITADSEGNET